MLLWLVVVCLAAWHVAQHFDFLLDHSAPSETQLLSSPLPSIDVGAETYKTPKYDCSGGLEIDSASGRENVERAIEDALDILRKCEPCRRMFDPEGSDYAIKLLEKLRRNKVFIISSQTPTEWRLSPDQRKLTVIKSTKLEPSGAAVKDLSGPKVGEMKRPCIYVNATGFIVTGRSAEYFALYGLDPPVQRAVAILHELGHVAGILQYDGEHSGDPENNAKSAANTNCVRANCISCKEFCLCPGAPVLRKKWRQNPPIRPERRN